MNSLVDSITNPLKAAGETAQGLIKIRDTAKFGDAVIELQTQILAAQSGALAAQSREATVAEEIRSLKEQVAKFEAWDREKNRYELTKLPPGVFVYALKDDESEAEVAHYLCTNCFENRKRSILQSKGSVNGLERFRCNACEAEIRTGHFREPQIMR